MREQNFNSFCQRRQYYYDETQQLVRGKTISILREHNIYCEGTKYSYCQRTGDEIIIVRGAQKYCDGAQYCE